MATKERYNEFIATLLSDCNDAEIQREAVSVMRQYTGIPNGTNLSCSEIISAMLNTEDEQIYLSGLRTISFIMFVGEGFKEEYAVKIVGNLIRRGFEKIFNNF